MLLERSELTSGSTWHAAANIHGLHDSTNISLLQHYTMALYKELEVETGQGCGIFQPGSLYLAQTEAREHQLRLQEAKARRYKMNFYEIGRDEAERLHPLVNFDGIRCIMYEPEGGNVDPSGVTMAYAAGARKRGAEIHRFTPVTGTEAQADGSWIVRTPKGDIRTGGWSTPPGSGAAKSRAMAGARTSADADGTPVFVTEDHSGRSRPSTRRLPSVADRDGEYYLRQEGLGLLIGAYERDMRFWAEEGTPLGFGHELFPDDLERIEENMMRAIDRVPGGRKRLASSASSTADDLVADSAVLFGPVAGNDELLLLATASSPASRSRAHGRLAAEWMIEGEPSLSTCSAGHGALPATAQQAFTRARVQDQYSHRSRSHFPNEERRPDARYRTRPAYEKQKAMGAVFGLISAEHPLWFSARGERAARETTGFTRQNWWPRRPRGPHAARKRRHHRHFQLCEIRGEGTGCLGLLNALFANRMAHDGRAARA